MRSRLFWKILLGFWVTLLLILQGVWIAYSVFWVDRWTYEYGVARIVAPYQLSAARLAIESGGLPRLDVLKTHWLEQERARERDRARDLERAETGDHDQDESKAAAKDGPKQEENEADKEAEKEKENWLRLTVLPAGVAPLPADDSQTQRARAVDPEGRAWDISYVLPPRNRREAWSLSDFLPYYLSAEWMIPSVLCGLLFSAVLAWYLTRPIQGLRTGFRHLADGRLDTRLQARMGRRRDEIADLASDFDRMAERLQQLIQAREQLLHDVSHELRSPLARLNLAVALAGHGEGAAREPLQRIQAEVRRLDVLVGELLSLSRRESGESELDAYFEMHTLVEAVIDDVSFEAAARGVPITKRIEASPHTLIQGSAELIRRAVENVVRNAVQFSAEGDIVQVSLSVAEAGRCVTVQVTDQGPGVAEADLQRMLEPFVRLQGEAKRQGYGLGLAIASRAVHSHRGRLAVANRPGGGLIVTLDLPLADVAPDLVEGIFES